MVESVGRTIDHPKLPNTFEILRVQLPQPQTYKTIQTWRQQAVPTPFPSGLRPPQYTSLQPSLFQQSQQLSSSGFESRTKTKQPLQITHGNRLPPPPRQSLKRKMSDRSDATVPRQSARLRKTTLSTPVNDQVGVRATRDIAIGRAGRSRKPAHRIEESDTLQEHPGEGGDMSQDEEEPDTEESVFEAQEPVQAMTTAPQTFGKPAGSGKTSSTTRTSSPSKGGVPLNKRERMSLMSPPVRFRDYESASDLGILPKNVKKLWIDAIRPVAEGFIPSEFKAEFDKAADTPNKSRLTIPKSYYAVTSESRFAKEDYALILTTVSRVVEMAKKYRHSGCTEAHWVSRVVNPLVDVVTRLQQYKQEGRKLEVLDMTTVQIGPNTLCPIHPDAYFKKLDKRIDVAIGLDLSEPQRQILQRGTYAEGYPASVNQTATFTSFIPMFMNIEAKMLSSDRDALIQLGTWIAAEFTKRQIEGYSLDMPVIAIEARGDDWLVYIVFSIEDQSKKNFDLEFIGPTTIGSTLTSLGVFEILHALCRCADWSLDQYQAWFKKQVLGKYTKKAKNEKMDTQ